MLSFGRDTCGELAISKQREWLVTNSIGGFASGTIAGVLTRRYHGLLVAALQPPLGRTLLVAKLDETVEYLGDRYELATNRWTSGVVEPAGYRYIEQFYLDGSAPVWVYACADGLLDKRIWMQPGANTTYVRYVLRRASAPMSLTLKVLVNYRDFHSTTQADGWQMQIDRLPSGIAVIAFAEATPGVAYCSNEMSKMRIEQLLKERSQEWQAALHLQAVWSSICGILQPSRL